VPGAALHVRGRGLPDGEIVEWWIVDGVLRRESVNGAETVFDGGWIVAGLVDAHCHVGLGRQGIVELDVAIAQAETAELARIPRIAGTVGYTRLSYIEPFLFAPGTPGIEFLQNNMAAKAEIGIPVADYVLRFPKLIAAAKAGEEAARVGRRSSELNAAQEARSSYYEWVRARLQVLVARRQLAQVESTLGQIRALADVQRVSRALARGQRRRRAGRWRRCIARG
jgi:hypothetical protein